MKFSKTLEKVQFASSIYDYFAAGVFAIPLIAKWHVNNSLIFTHQLFGSVGSFPEFEPFHLLFVCLFGGFAVMWSTLSIAMRLPVLGLCDGLLRTYFAFLMLYAVLVWRVTSILWIFIAVEMILGFVQVFLYIKSEKYAYVVKKAM